LFVCLFNFQPPRECIWQLAVPVSARSQWKQQLGGLFLPRGGSAGVRGIYQSPPLSPCPLPRAMCSGKLQTGLLVGSYFVYLLVGAAVFQALERTAEKQQKMAAAQMKEAFLQNFTHLTVAEMEQFMKVGAIPVEALSPAHFPIRCCFLLLKMLFLLECSCGLFLQAPNPLPGLRRQIIPICTQIQVDVVW